MRLAISGKMTSGKTTMAAKLMAIHPNFVKVSFADPIYDIAREYFNMQEKDRDLLIHIGESFRARDANVWINAFLRKVDQLEAQGKWVLVDDLRLLSEHSALRKHGFKLVRLNVSSNEQERRLKNKYPETFQEHLTKIGHVTECALDEVDDWDLYATEDAPLHIVSTIVSNFTTPTRT